MSHPLNQTSETSIAPTTPPVEGAPASVEGGQTHPSPSADKPKETASALLAKLAKQRKEQMQLSKKFTAVDTEKQELLKRIQELEGKVSQKPKDPLEALKSAGFGYEDATNFVLNDSKLTPDQQVKQLEQKLEEMQRSFQEQEEKRLKEEADRAQKSVQEQEEMFKTDVLDFLDQNKETYELTSREDGAEVAETVLSVIKQHFATAMKEWEESGRQGKRPKALSTKDALDLIEQHLEEKVSSFFETNKIKSKFAPKPSETEQKSNNPAPSSKTLTSAVTSAPASPSAKINDPIARALNALERMGK